MMLKNKQTNCLFVNFKKEIKTKGIGNICFWIIKIKTDINILTDKLNGDIAVMKTLCCKYILI